MTSTGRGGGGGGGGGHGGGGHGGGGRGGGGWGGGGGRGYGGRGHGRWWRGGGGNWGGNWGYPYGYSYGFNWQNYYLQQQQYLQYLQQLAAAYGQYPQQGPQASPQVAQLRMAIERLTQQLQEIEAAMAAQPTTGQAAPGPVNLGGGIAVPQACLEADKGARAGWPRSIVNALQAKCRELGGTFGEAAINIPVGGGATYTATVTEPRGVIVRAGPGTNYAQIGYLPAGSPVAVTPRDVRPDDGQGGIWWMVNYMHDPTFGEFRLGYVRAIDARGVRNFSQLAVQTTGRPRIPYKSAMNAIVDEP